MSDCIDSATARIPEWDGGDPAGKTILVSCERDLGDSIQSVRYVLLLQGRGAKVILSCPPALMRLFGCLPNVRVIADDAVGRRLLNFDCHVRLGSLARMFDTTPATIPTFNAYLRPPERAILRRPDARRTLGLCLGEVQELAALRGAVPDSFDVTHVSPISDDLADTACTLTRFSLLIATESPVAHLAGAMGKAVWTLVRSPADSRWGIAGPSCAWYPSARLFHQGEDGDWSRVVREVMLALRNLPAKNPPLAA